MDGGNLCFRFNQFFFQATHSFSQFFAIVGELAVVVKKSVASEIIQATCFSGSATVTWSSRSGL
ncbi:hypothetical protein, partial [Halomonas halodenitrificans]|uniref:hypothetical protein n=1 Tax=Halomonas halodenitrificans TaxID=28252 RepID=UPI001B801B32